MSTTLSSSSLAAADVCILPRNSRDSSLRPIAAGMTLPMTQSQFSLYCVEFAAPGTSIAHAAVSKIFEARACKRNQA